MKDIIKFIKGTKICCGTLGILSLLLTGCAADGLDLPWDGKSPNAIDFNGLVAETREIQTRAIETNIITVDPYDMDFNIEMLYEPEGEEKQTEIKTYRIPSGYKGKLEAVDTDEPLNWKDLNSPHTFWTWNDQYYLADGQQPEDYYSTLPGILEPRKIKFFDSKEEDGSYETYNNNAKYETFIGTKAGPVIYKNNGQYVQLIYKHLVSKMAINKLTLIKSDNSVQNDVIGEITFLGLTDEAWFYPHPTAGNMQSDGLTTPDPEGAPVVIPIPNETNKLTYTIKSKPGQPDYCYIPPETDFKKLAFYINITDDRYFDYGDHGNYYGTFDNVIFKRETGVDYDKGDGSDDTVLHAGEMMELDVVVWSGIGPGIFITIKDWNTERSENSEHHSRAGIYTDSEAASFTASASWANLYELYGETDADSGEKVFNFYDNATVTSTSFPTPRDYVVNGRGHLLNMKSSSNKVTVGEMRDIFISDGTNTIYIDTDGKIYTVTDGVLKATGSSLGGLTSDNQQYQIDLKTGSVSKTTVNFTNLDR